MSKKTNIFKDFFKYFISKKFIINIILAFILVVVILGSTFLFLKKFTNHGQQFYTPSFKGLTVSESHQLAKEKKLKIEIIDSTADAFGKKGTIIDQTPPTNFMVKQGRTIFLTKKNLLARKIAMPNLKNMSLIEANAIVATSKLKIGKKEYRPSKYENYVLEQKVSGQIIKPGTIIEEGTTIDLVVGQSKDGEETKIPDLTGLTLADAAIRATDNSLNIGAAIFDNTVITKRDTLDAVVYKQTPKKNWKADLGDAIDIWLK